MLIKLQDLKKGEIISVENSYDPKKLDMEFVDFHYLEPLAMTGTVEKSSDILTFRGHLHSRTELMCGRCLSKNASSLDKDFELFYEIEGKDEIDATDDLREMLILEHPLTYLCSDRCRGLCPQCGINLNESSCKCRPSSEHSLSKLKDIWKKGKQESK